MFKKCVFQTNWGWYNKVFCDVKLKYKDIACIFIHLTADSGIIIVLISTS